MEIVIWVLFTFIITAISLIKHVPILRKCSCPEHSFEEECVDNLCLWNKAESRCEDIPCDARN